MPIYGLVLRSDPDAQVQEWVATEDIDDLLKPDSMFIPCDSARAGRQVLAERFPVPEVLAGKLADVATVVTVVDYHASSPDRSGYLSGFRVFPQGRITGVRHHRYNLTTAKLADALVTAGGGVIGSSQDPYSSTASHHQVAHALRRDPMFKASDLVLRETGYGYEVVRDPKKAKARRTREISKRRNDDAAAENQKVSDAAARKRAAVYEAAHAAAVALWDSQAVTRGLAAPESVCGHRWSWHWESVPAFWRVVALHEALTRKGAWRAFGEVDALLDACGRVDDAFDDKFMNPGNNPHSYQDLGAALARFGPEIKRLARRRRREARRAGRPAEAVEPAAV